MLIPVLLFTIIGWLSSASQDTTATTTLKWDFLILFWVQSPKTITHTKGKEKRGKKQVCLFVCFPPNQLPVIKMHAWIATRWKQCYTTPISGIYLGDYHGGSLCIHSTELNDKKGSQKTLLWASLYSGHSDIDIIRSKNVEPKTNLFWLQHLLWTIQITTGGILFAVLASPSKGGKKNSISPHEFHNSCSKVKWSRNYTVQRNTR